LERLLDTVRSLCGEPIEGRAFVDSGPVLERDFAGVAGLGWIGKNMMLINPEIGSFTFIGVVLTDADLAPDLPFEADRCGSCRRCLDACPTQAFDGPHRIDARKCISYLTIEHEGPIPAEFRRAMGNRIYGCDDCLAVCPWNRFAEAAAANRAFLPRAELAAPRLADLLGLDDAAFREMFAGSPIKRIGVKRMTRNCLVAAGNSRDASLAQSIRPHLADPDPVIAEAAQWALAQIEGFSSAETHAA
jgi:epoxyqueuosine reductase